MIKRKILLLVLLVFSSITFARQVENEIRKSAITFLDSLTPLQKKRALVDSGDTARVQWNNLPVGLRARAGISIGTLWDEQRKLVHRILSSFLSSQGYLKATGIMHLDNLLNMYVDTLHQRKQISDKGQQGLLESRSEYVYFN